MISNNEKFIKELTNLISFKSKLGKAEENAPFGVEIKNALNYFLELARSFGFETVNYDNYFGEVVWGEGEEFGIIGHLDVVPEGRNWDTDPYTLTKKDGKYFGRGMQDDKTPLLMCLFAMASLKEKGIVPNKKVRLFLGCDEENDWRCVDYFLKNNKFPKYGFSPDSDFPAVYAEKGIYLLKFEYEYDGKFSNIGGGTVFNAVCDYASAKGEIDQKIASAFNLTVENGAIVSKGKAAHSSMPEKGINAFKNLFAYMSKLDEKLKPLCENVFFDGKKISELKNDVGLVTFSPNLVSQKDGKISVTVDLRIPYGIDLNKVTALLDKTEIPYSVKQKRKPLYVDKNSEIVTKLLGAYQSVTGEVTEPKSLGGVTFSSVFEKGVAFGPEFEDEKGNIHEPNEFMSEEKMNKAYEIYLKAIENIVT